MKICLKLIWRELVTIKKFLKVILTFVLIFVVFICGGKILKKEYNKQLIKKYGNETKNKLSEMRTGKIWIHRGKETKSIKPELLEDFIKDGWEKGRGKLK